MSHRFACNSLLSKCITALVRAARMRQSPILQLYSIASSRAKCSVAVTQIAISNEGCDDEALQLFDL